MTKRLIGLLVLAPLSLLLVLFALANRHMVAVRFDPLMSEPALVGSVQVPLFIVIYAMLIIGIFLGGVATWFAQGELRQQKRHLKKQVHQMEAERNKAKNLEENSNESKALFDPS
ncbi:MAG: LapA family protein [Devosiaceae bacterium]|nr:LapA family protein [Devosiaceae bacterium]